MKDETRPGKESERTGVEGTPNGAYEDEAAAATVSK
jgi:hypothetical protein